MCNGKSAAVIDMKTIKNAKLIPYTRCIAGNRKYPPT